VADAETGFRFFTLRAHPDPGSQTLSENQHKLKQVPDRHPWQRTSQATFPGFSSGADVVLEAVPGMKDEHGLAVYIEHEAGRHARAPDPSKATVTSGRDQGSLWHDNKERGAALVFIFPEEGASGCARAKRDWKRCAEFSTPPHTPGRTIVNLWRPLPD
jgi:hypothetical protein